MAQFKVNDQFRAIKKIGHGAFGDIYEGESIDDGSPIAIKVESADAKPPQLEFEARMYKMMSGYTGISDIYYYGRQGDKNILVMDLLGPSLEDLFGACKRQFSLKTTLMLTDEMISRLEFLHLKHFIHRDQKPDNYCIGRGSKRTTVFLIDYGLSKHYILRDEHIPYREHKALTGTARYCSTNTHMGMEQSRRDDLESVGYIMVYFMRGSLPWEGIQAQNKKQKYEKIMQKKMDVSLEQLCRGLPPEFEAFLNYARQLKFDQRPDYAYLRKLVRETFFKSGFSYDFIYDWNLQGIDTDSYFKDKNETQGVTVSDAAQRGGSEE